MSKTSVSLRTDSTPAGVNPQNASAVSALPETYKVSFPAIPEGINDRKAFRLVHRNPITDLCTRLATYYVDARGNGCYDAVGKPNRLYRNIGRKLKPSTLRRMIHSSQHQWKLVEECWVANMHTVLLNQEYNPFRYDGKLFRAIRKYKLWFLEFFFSGRLRTITKRDGKKARVFVPTNFEKGLKALKNLAGWLQYVAVSDMRSENVRPPSIPYWNGWISQDGYPRMLWFSGHLSKYRDICRDVPYIHDQSVVSNLCQIRTFGRALPCPTQSMCRDAFKEQLEILTEVRETPSEVLNIVSIFAKRLGEKLGVGSMPTQTHISVSTSGCYERSQTEGGLAGYASTQYKQIDKSVSSVQFLIEDKTYDFWSFLRIYHSKNIHDVYGESIFPRSQAFYLTRPGTHAICPMLYGTTSLTGKLEFMKKLLETEKTLPPTLGKVLLLISSTEAHGQGYFENLKGEMVEPSAYMSIEGYIIPLYFERKGDRLLRYVPKAYPLTKLDCLAEPGAKTRPLGKNQAWFTFVNRAARFMAEPIFSRDGRARIGLRSTNKMWSFLKYLKASGPQYKDPICQSTDYKSATDLIPLDLIRAMWDGFLTSLPKTHPFWVFYTTILCPRLLFKAKKFRKELDPLFPEGLPNKRGSFMGEPMSFLTLTLINLLIEEISSSYFFSKSKLWSPVGLAPDLKGDPLCICGDDVAALRENIRRIRLFKQVAVDMGMKFSWKDTVSRVLMVFCEDHAFAEGKGRDFKVRYIDIIKSRLLTTMARQHSDNRSSILGKGRMLRNQLDYFESQSLKLSVLSTYSKILSRSYGGKTIENCRFPLYLPPCAGGAGIPCLDSLIPDWMWPYIGHVFNLLEIEDFHERYVELESLAALNSRVKHGITSQEKLNILYREVIRYEYKPGLSHAVSPNCVYDEEFVVELLDTLGTAVPLDPYTNQYDWSSLENEAAIIGFIPFSQLAEQVERVLNFQDFFLEEKEREQRTFNRWVKDSRKYWKTRVTRSNKHRLAEIGKSQFKSMVDMEKKILRSFKGFIWLGETMKDLNLINSGPSLKIRMDLLPYGKRSTTRLRNKEESSLESLISRMR